MEEGEEELSVGGTDPRGKRRWRPSGFVDGTIDRWKPPGRSGPAWWHVQHDDGDGEELEEAEVREALKFYANGAFSTNFHELIASYVRDGVLIRDGRSVLRVEREALPAGFDDHEAYFNSRDLYVGNAYGHVQSMYLASSLGSQMTISCREPFVCVLPKAAQPRPSVQLACFTDSGAISHAKVHGWPSQHPAAKSIASGGVVRGRCIRSRAVVLAGMVWPKSYEFLPERLDDDEGERKDVCDNDGVVAHIVGNAVMPALAAAIMRSAIAAVAPTAITSIVDLCCGGGGFSLGASEALPGLQTLDGVDKNGIVLRNFVHNIRLRLPSAAVAGHQAKACFDLTQLSAMLGRPVEAGMHVHMSPPCQGDVNKSKKNGGSFNIRPCLELMVAAAAVGCTCTLEEHRRAKDRALRWLREHPTAHLFVYLLDARDYAAPTTRVRCVVSTFPLIGERALSEGVLDPESDTEGHDEPGDAIMPFE